ncbi:MAG: M48 family metalloprotease [Gemmatimonadetes bacterium]|nr:M48 family metalloprotease [Gemmatimonadota bacterium]
MSGEAGRGSAWRTPAAVAALGLSAAGIGLWLGSPAPRVLPVDPAAHFDGAFLERAAAYAGLKYSFWAAATILKWGALAALIAFGGGRSLARAASRLARGRRWWTAFFAMALLLAALALVGLPLSYASGYRVERAFGLSPQTSAQWALDWLRIQAFWSAVYSALAAGFLACLARWPRRGWLVAALGGAAVAVAGTFLAPRVIDPLFHDFTPLANEELEGQIIAVGRSAGLDIGRVVVMDASRRTRRLNAYVTGLGATRQVVLYDNLLEEAPRGELLLVVAHEIGHAAEGHVRQGLLWALPGIAAGAWALSALARGRARREARLTSPWDPAGLPALWLAASILILLSSPLSSALSRGMEAEADWIALELTRDAATFIAVEERLTRANLSPVTPPGWIVRWFYSHPPVLDRIGMAKYWLEAVPHLQSRSR